MYKISMIQRLINKYGEIEGTKRYTAWKNNVSEANRIKALNRVKK